MRRTLLLAFVLMIGTYAGYAQSPPGINYQGIARNPDGKPLALKDIAIRVNILRDGANGDVEYSEIHVLKTNSFGLFTLVIGSGQVENGNFAFISWAVGNKWLRVDMDTEGGNAFKTMGSQQFMSVPYAFYAKYSGNTNGGGGPPPPPLVAGQGIQIDNNIISITSDVDNSATNELQNLSASSAGTTRTIAITNGTSATIDIDDGDANSTNEIQNLSLSSNTLTLSAGTGSPSSVNLAPFMDNTDNQQMTLLGNTLSLTNDMTPVDLSSYLDDTDEQRIFLAGTNLSIDRGGSVNLSGFLDNTDNQDLSLNPATHSLSLTSDPTPVNLSAYLDNTDGQSLSLGSPTVNTRTINIQNATGVTFNIDDADANPANEIQSLTFNNATRVLSLSSSNTVTIPDAQTLNQVLTQGNDANGQRISNIAAPAASNDATTKQYVDAADAATNARISANYAFKANFSYSQLLSVGNNITIPLTDNFDSFSVVGATTFTAATAGTYLFFVDGSISSILGGPSISILYSGTKYPVAIASNNRYNSTFMFQLTAGQTVSLVGDGLGIGSNISGTFFGHKLP